MSKKPWETEPDRIEWNNSNGYDCVMKRANHGAWCGYVCVENKHTAFKKTTSDLEFIEIHGGVTWADHNIPNETENENLWWIGFDCAHSYDLIPKMDATSYLVLNEITGFHDALSGVKMPEKRSQYRDAEYVRAEVEALAKQLEKMDE